MAEERVRDAAARTNPAHTIGAVLLRLWDHALDTRGFTSLRGHPEHVLDQLHLTDDVTLRYPSRLSLTERMHDLDAAQGPPRRGESLEAVVCEAATLQR